MTEKSLFSVLIRVIGLVLLLLVIEKLYSIAAAWVVRESTPLSPGGDFDFSGTLFWAIVWKAALGIYLFRGAPLLIELAYLEIRGKRTSAKKFIT